MYYVLTSYYQSHRHYAGSWDGNQLKGRYYPLVDYACYPYDYEQHVNTTIPSMENKMTISESGGGLGRPIAPCGIIANSLFNDTFSLRRLTDGYDTTAKIPINRTDIAWPTDRFYKFRNPSDPHTFSKWAKPPNWPRAVDQLDPSHADNNGFLNEGFLVWMRVGAFPTTRKLYGRVYVKRDGDSTTVREGLPAGNYSMRIKYREYRVDERNILIMRRSNDIGYRPPVVRENENDDN